MEPLSPDALDWLLDPNTGDLSVPSSGIVPLVSGGEAIAQLIRIAFNVWRGEWFADSRVGMPYFEEILITGVTLTSLEGVFRRALLKVPGVLSVVSISLSRPQPRRLLVTWEAKTTSGLLRSSDFQPFIVDI